MNARWLRIFLIFETARLLAWLVLFWSATETINPRYSNEALMVPIVESFFLGFPYSWSAMMLVGRWNLGIFGSDAATARGILLDHFAVWLICTCAVLVVITLRSKRRRK
jgi:hypothetical protein